MAMFIWEHTSAVSIFRECLNYQKRLVSHRWKPAISAERLWMHRRKKCVTLMGMEGISDLDALDSSSILIKKTDAPLVDALIATAEIDVACFHFPGHNRGKAAPSALSDLIGRGTFTHDLPVPDLPELDDLFSPKGAISDAQVKAAKLFGASETWFLVGGTTCGIQASIMATCCPGDVLILPRNSHISATSGLILSGAMPKYILPEYSSHWNIAGGVTPAQVETAIKELEGGGKAAAAVLVTSPTYHGICSKLSEITKLCHSRGIPVIVDEAHGAHLRFHPNFPSTALEQGADLAVQSTHKVLSSLTQSSMLHASGNLIDRERITKCLQILQSSSPSYLLLASLDAARAQIEENPDTIFSNALALSLLAKHEIRKIPGVSLREPSCFVSGFPAIDPLRISLGVSQLHMSGYVADKKLWEGHRIIPELVGSKSLTFAVNLGTTRKDVERLISGIKTVSIKFFKGSNLQSGGENGVRIRAPTTCGSMQLSPRNAFFARKRRVCIRESLGEICGELICPYPPGIPVMVPGEVITDEAVSYLLNVMRIGAEIKGSSDHRLSSILICT
ncbi:arginine decarboxylase-like isoform X2 [Zingiber officinale]|uniref:arginine decarboxylase-like isoform X2 n=1 Tax=Zingiber officinale TaxID=94328 RepID=UPI001C4CDA64|nr:arginine decarboxylase-like isoform X2 [Zingiber officinale]